MKNSLRTLVYALLFLLCFISKGICQSGELSTLKVGDQVPSYQINNIINYPKKASNFSEFGGKLLLLDFWDRNCASCIASWPKMQKLKDEFKDQLEIILYNNRDNEKVVRSIIDKQRQLKKVNLTLPVVCGDSNIKKLFPFSTVPHVIWIKDGKVKAITDGLEVNVQNVGAVLKNQQVILMMKDQIKFDVNFRKPLYVGNNGGDPDHMIWYSSVSEFYPGLYGTTFFDSTHGLLSNITVPTMLRFLMKDETDRFGALNFFPESRLELHVKDTTKYVDKVNDIVQHKNYYTYQTISKYPMSPQDMRSIMLEDIKKYFAINFHFEKKVKPCLVLSVVDKSKFKLRDDEIQMSISEDDIVMNNVSLTEFISVLMATTNYHHSPYPIIDETGYNDMIGGIVMHGDLMDHVELDKQLSNYGLRLQIANREVQVLVITDALNRTDMTGIK